MSFWEIMFNVLAGLWSPLAITFYAMSVGVLLFAHLVAPPPRWEAWQVVLTFFAWIMVSVLAWSFLIWWSLAGFNAVGWHLPLTV